MQFREEIHQYIQNNQNEMIDILKKLIQIPSVRGEPSDHAPYGTECARVLEFTRELYERNGFETEYVPNQGYLLSGYGTGEKSIGIFAHGDIVPAGQGWLQGEPFEPIEKGGCLLGRGTLDDKSAVVISLFCAKMVKELGLPFRSRLVLFTGVNEETGMQDIQDYLSRHQAPDFSIVPDYEFPLYRGNKGKYAFTLRSRQKLTKGISVTGGSGSSVMQKVTVTLPDSENLWNELQTCRNPRIDITQKDGAILLTGTGIARSSANPAGSISALAVVAEELCGLQALSQDDRSIFRDLYEMSRGFFGEFFGIEDENPEIGTLTAILSQVETDRDGFVTAHIYIRYVNPDKKDHMLRRIGDKIEAMSWENLRVTGCTLPHALPENHPFVKAMLDVYGAYTGNPNPISYINNSGTYRQYLKNAVETGLTISHSREFDLPPGHGAIHQPDEYIPIQGFLDATELTMHMLLEADRILYT